MWDEAIADAKAGYGLTGGPLVANGKVMVGTTGRAPGGNFIVALDAETGKRGVAHQHHRADRARTAAPAGTACRARSATAHRCGCRAATTASLEPRVLRTGADLRHRPAPQSRSDEANVTNDGLYTDSTLAINVDTGRLVWFFQHQPNDQWDLRLGIRAPGAAAAGRRHRRGRWS